MAPSIAVGASNTVKKQWSLLFDGKEVRAEVYADRAKQASIFISREQNSGKNQDLKAVN